jgi:hypothetical protein
MRDFTEEDLDDISAALRVAGSSLEMVGLNFDPADHDLDEESFRKAKVAMRRQAARYRRLAGLIVAARAK